MATATDNELAQTAKWQEEVINSNASVEDIANGSFKMSYEALEEEYNKACERAKEIVKENEELKNELVELRKFAQYVRGLKTHEDFNKLRNVILTTNKNLGI